MNTSFLPAITEIRLIGVVDAGIPNKERIVLKSEAHIDIGWYAVILGARVPNPHHASPMKDCMYWFGSGTIAPKDWLFLYTGSGSNSVFSDLDGGKIFIEHWGKKQTIFHDTQIVPVLWRLSGVVVEKSENTLQLPLLGK